MNIATNSFPILETSRLRLREIKETDAASMLAYLSDTEVMKHYGLEPFQTIEEAFDEISWYQSTLKQKTGIRWGITLKEEGVVIGSCGFLNIASQHYRSEIGYELHRNYWGKGIASEALGAVLAYGFEQLKLQRIQALIEPPNIASIKLAEKQGFVREGLLRNYEYTCGKFDDMYMYSLLGQDFATSIKGKL
ncbi:GNAT family N-acetyltransferase [Oceanobacillus profundus]|uniref:GNAT family N-acetyltransferase n=2 Tax=Bacteria TaxID=2 RepID=UPI000BA721BC|nr:GNAT family protein [Oceanobacillus profundus]MCM3399787.1 GNAT family N-acetyltransferase [Oceanobacillus profundus]PAE28176.1 N-acetyltransferase [Paenibacillus sp. 7884-2]